MSAKAKAPAPAFSARAVSSCLTRAGLERRKKPKGCRAWYGDFSVNDVALWTLPKGSSTTIQVSVTSPAGGGALARQRNQAKAAAALEAAGYVLSRNDPNPNKFGIGVIWVVAPAKALP